MVKVNYDDNGTILGFYPDDINYEDIPEPYIEITNEQHADCFRNPGKRKVDTKNKQIVVCDAPSKTVNELLNDIRMQRNQLLANCDWTALPDVPLSLEKQAAWANYRQTLRNMPETCDPRNPVWPIPPQ